MCSAAVKYDPAAAIRLRHHDLVEGAQLFAEHGIGRSAAARQGKHRIPAAEHAALQRSGARPGPQVKPDAPPRNGVADRFKVLVGDLSDKASGQYNIITANIVAAAILSLAPHVPVLMAPDARFIASGIIDERKDEVLAGLRAAGLAPVEVKEKRGWVCIICQKSETKEA